MRRLFAILACMTLAACASGAKPDQMVAPLDGVAIAAGSPLKNAVSVGSITGGSKTSPLWKSEVSNEDFAEALRKTFAAQTMLASGTGRFVLNAELIELDQPFAGFDMKVTSVVKYRLTNADGSKSIFESTVTKAYTADFSSTFLGVERLRLANEGSMRENIKQFVGELIAASEKDPAFKLDQKAISELERLIPAPA